MQEQNTQNFETQEIEAKETLDTPVPAEKKKFSKKMAIIAGAIAGAVIAITIALILLLGGNDTGIKLTVAEIQAVLTEEDGTLTTSGASDNVTSFTFVVTSINASNLMDKTFTRKAVTTLLTDSSKVTYGQFKACNAFIAVMNSVSLVSESDDEEFNANDYIEEILSIICDGTSKTYGNWTISATVNTAADSITVSATSN